MEAKDILLEDAIETAIRSERKSIMLKRALVILAIINAFLFGHVLSHM